MSLLSQQGSVSSIVVHFSNQNVFFRLTNNIGEVTNKKSHIRNARKHQILFFFFIFYAPLEPGLVLGQTSVPSESGLVTSVGLFVSFVILLL